MKPVDLPREWVSALAASTLEEAPATILVVDDTPANLSLLASVLAPRWRVQLAPSGAKALDLLSRPGRPLPDLIVLDVMMPDLDGYTVCRRLKADARAQHIPVLFLTALNQPEDETRGFDSGGADFIHKPFNPATVVARVATQLDAKRWRDMLAQRNQWLESELQRLGQPLQGPTDTPPTEER